MSFFNDEHGLFVTKYAQNHYEVLIRSKKFKSFLLIFGEKREIERGVERAKKRREKEKDKK